MTQGPVTAVEVRISAVHSCQRGPRETLGETAGCDTRIDHIAHRPQSLLYRRLLHKGPPWFYCFGPCFMHVALFSI